MVVPTVFVCIEPFNCEAIDTSLNIGEFKRLWM